MDFQKSIINYVYSKQLIWFGHIQRIADEILPKVVLDWLTERRRRRGRSITWKMGISKLMQHKI